MTSHRFIRYLLAPAVLFLGLQAGWAAPLSVAIRSVDFVDPGAPTTFSFSIFAPLAGVQGRVQVKTDIVGVYADAGRDGASVGLAANAPGIVSGSLRLAGAGDQLLTAAGDGSALAATGGSAGEVHLARIGVTDFGAPSEFGFSSTQPIGNPGGLRQAHASVGAAIMDFGSDGASLSGNRPGGAFASASVHGGGPVEPTPHTLLGQGFAAVGQGAALSDSAAALVDCSAVPCNRSTMTLDVDLSGGDDLVVALLRQEIGGSPQQGDRVAAYTLAGDTAQFDCGLAGCDRHSVTLSFDGSGGGDVFSFIIRQEISVLAFELPEPAMPLLLLTAGAAMAGSRALAGRRRSLPQRIA